MHYTNNFTYATPNGVNTPLQGMQTLPCGMQMGFGATSIRPTSTAPSPMLQDQAMMAQNLQTALNLIRQSIAGEKEDEMFYDYLISTAPSAEDKKIIESIRDDERKHYKMFREIYFDLTGQMLPPPAEPQFKKPESYLAGIQRALFGELGAVEKYRQILFGMLRRKHINMMTEIITDELKHATKYNFLYAKNKR